MVEVWFCSAGTETWKNQEREPEVCSGMSTRIPQAQLEELGAAALVW